jgi:hypothetical protein
MLNQLPAQWKLFVSKEKELGYYRLVCLLAILLFSGSYLYATYSANCQTPDSRIYLSVAGYIHQYGTFPPDSIIAYYHWGPLFPLILSLINPDNEISIRLLQYFALAGSFLCWFIIGYRFLQPKIRLIYPLLICLTPSILASGVFIWSEAVFYLFFSLYCLGLVCLLNKAKGGRQWLWLAALAGFFMCLQRNAGVFFLPGSVGFLGYLAYKDRTNWKAVALLLLVSIGGFLVWNYYALVSANRAAVAFELFPVITPWQNLARLGSELTIQLMPLPKHMVIGLGFILVLAGILIYGSRYLNNSLKLLLSLVIGYWAVWVAIPASDSDIDRFLSPTILPFWLLLLTILQGIADRYAVSKKLIAALLSLWLLYPLARTVNNAILWHNCNL